VSKPTKKPQPTLRQQIRAEIRRWMKETGLSFKEVIDVLYRK
jgi:predicted XRE-type DNA-binding protein